MLEGWRTGVSEVIIYNYTGHSRKHTPRVGGREVRALQSVTRLGVHVLMLPPYTSLHCVHVKTPTLPFSDYLLLSYAEQIVTKCMPGANCSAIFWHCHYLFQSYADDVRTGAEEARSNAKSRSSQSSRSARKPRALGRRSNVSLLSSLGEYLHTLKHTMRLHLSQDPLPGGLCICFSSFSWSIQRMCACHTQCT